MIVVSKQIRNAAKGERCTLRLQGCNFNPETTTGAHVPCGQKGVGMKSPDTMIIFACSECARRTDLEPYTILAKDWLRALAETHLILIEKGLLIVKGMKQ
jgi:hypothetical protein